MEFDAYLQQQHRALLRFATTLTGDGELAQEIVQDVLLRAFQRWSTIAELERPHAYVRRMVVNEHLSWRRRWSRVEPHADVPTALAESDGAGARAERDALVREILRLPRRQRVVLALRYLEDVPDAEIAEILGCEPATVRSIAARALGRLRVRLVEPDPPPLPAPDPDRPAPSTRIRATQEATR